MDDKPEMSQVASAAYGAFLWQLMKARPALKTLAHEAFATRDRDAISPAEEGNPNKLIYALLASAGRGMQNEINQSIRNNCAGAALQVAWTLFDAHLELLGVRPKARRNVEAGQLLNGREPFSRVLWASRNAFAHGIEWAATGPRTPAGRESVRILESVGFSKPTHMQVYDYFVLLSDGDVEIFIQRLERVAKDIAAAQPIVVVDQSWKSTLSGIVGLLILGLIFLVYFSSQKPETEVEGVLLFQMGEGDDAKVVPFARGKIGSSPAQIQSVLEQAAAGGLSQELARPFKELEARFAAWMANADVLSKTDVGSERFYRDLMAACEQMDEIYQMALDLPSPVTLLFEQRGCKNIEEAQAVLSDLLKEHAGLTPEPFRVIDSDLAATIRARANSLMEKPTT